MPFTRDAAERLAPMRENDQHFVRQKIQPSQSEPISMLEALMIAKAVLPLASFRSLAASAVIEEVSFTPGAISMTTRLLIGPFLMETILPARTLRALSFMIFGWVELF
jgi:hypothetical protein